MSFSLPNSDCKKLIPKLDIPTREENKGKRLVTHVLKLITVDTFKKKIDKLTL